jgi:fermentation-respiration switch protein FrsA (DUF1100 family)
MHVAWKLLGAVVVVGLLAFMANRCFDAMMFHPQAGVQIHPDEVGVNALDVELETNDGVRIHAFFLPAEAADRAVLFLHGNAGNASHRLPNAALMLRMGAHVLLLDYRGYGLSQGRPSEAGVFSDARAGLAWLESEAGIPASRIVVFGRSLGGAVAVDLAQDRELAGIVLESTFASAGDVARRHFGPIGGLLAGSRFDSTRKITRLRAPLLALHGDRDDIVAIESGRTLFTAAPEPKAFETIAGAGHNDTVEIGGRAYLARLHRFLDTVAPVAPIRE